MPCPDSPRQWHPVLTDNTTAPSVPCPSIFCPQPQRSLPRVATKPQGTEWFREVKMARSSVTSPCILSLLCHHSVSLNPSPAARPQHCPCASFTVSQGSVSDAHPIPTREHRAAEKSALSWKSDKIGKKYLSSGAWGLSS